MKIVWEFIVKNKKVILIIFAIFVFLFIVIPLLNKSMGDRKLSTIERGVCGIAKVVEYRPGTRSSYYKYTFEYRNKKYNKRYYTNPNWSPEVGKRYFVLIDPEHPWFNSMLLVFPVPDSIKEAPPEGWKECPGVSREQIREFLDHY